MPDSAGVGQRRASVEILSLPLTPEMLAPPAPLARAPFRDDQKCLRWMHYPQPPDRRRRIEVFCGAYGIAVPGDIVDRVAGQQRLVLEQCAALARQGIEPQATWVRGGYLDTVRARIEWTEALRV
jgi:hypothetical protein